VFHVGEGEMGDFMVFWVCFMVEKEREEKVVNSREKGGAGGCRDVETGGIKGERERKEFWLLNLNKVTDVICN
jgi:hypothetical protein